MKAQDLKRLNRPPNILLYGPAGSGKTALVSQASRGYMFDFDDGMLTAANLQDQFSPLRNAIEFDVYVDADVESPTAYQQAKVKLLSLREQMCSSSTSKPFDAVVIDSLTGMCRAIQLYVMGLKGNPLAIPRIQDYGQFINEVEGMLTILRSIPVLTLVTAHEMLVETDSEVLVRIMSATRPHGMNKLPWLFDEVLHTRAVLMPQNKRKYVVSGRSTSAIATRTRSGITDDVNVIEIGLKGFLKMVGFNYG